MRNNTTRHIERVGRHGRWVGMSAMVGIGLFAASCAHHQKALTEARLQPDAKRAVDRTRGTCPTDLNNTETLLEKGNPVRLIFLTSDPSNREELSRRVASVGQTLASPHPAVNAAGKEIEHAATPTPVLREASSNDTDRFGWELDVPTTSDDQRREVVADLQDHVRLWRLGECPEMANAPFHSTEAKRPSQTVLREDR